MATTVGTGDFTYEVAEGWGELPEGFEWGQMGSVNTDSQDRVHIFTRTTNPVMVFDRDGKFLSTWGGDIFKDAHGLNTDGRRQPVHGGPHAAGGDEVHQGPQEGL